MKKSLLLLFYIFVTLIALVFLILYFFRSNDSDVIITLPSSVSSTSVVEETTPREVESVLEALVSATSTVSSTLALDIVTSTPPFHISTSSPQFVVLAFDGSYSIKKWKETLDFAKEMKLAGKPIHYTYFLSGVYFLGSQYRSLYTPPGHPVGSSAIGFAINKNDIKARVAAVNRAIAEGHEIGSHLVGHYNGVNWTADDWQQEFDSFENIMLHIAKSNHVTDTPDYHINFGPHDLLGLRAPELGHNNAMFDVLKDHAFQYDTSLSAKQDVWPIQLKNGIWEFPLAQIKYADEGTNILSMDYNFYFKQSQGMDTTTKDTALWKEFYDKTYSSYINYFNHNYQGNHAPVFIGSHFSDWNDGVYWEAMKNFAREVCGKPQVRCVSYREVMDYMNSLKK